MPLSYPHFNDLPPPHGKKGWPWDFPVPETSNASANEKIWPKICIVTPNLNYGDYLEETIRSILLQKYPNLEYIILDGGSIDGSIAVIKKYQKWIARWSSKKDNGQSDALNQGFQQSTAEIFGWLNSDDVLLPNALITIAQYWNTYPECEFITGNGEFINSDGSKQLYFLKGEAYVHSDLLKFHRHHLAQPSTFFSRAAFTQAGNLNTHLRYAMDLDLWLRIIRIRKLHYLPVTLSRLRVHEEAKNTRERIFAIAEAKTVIKTHCKNIPLIESFSIHIGLCRLYSITLCAQGMVEYFSGNHLQALKMLGKSFFYYPGILFKKCAWGLALRLILCKSIKRMIFKVP